MKGVSFKKKESVLRVLDEEVKKNKYNWDRVLYFVLLAIALFFVIRYIYMNYIFVRAKGQVIIENVDVRLINDARIEAYQVKEGDVVHIGDSLFTYYEDPNQDDFGGGFGADGVYSSSRPSNWPYQARFDIDKRIAFNRLLIQQNNGEVASLTSKYKKLENQVILGVLPIGKLESVENEIVNLKYESRRLQAEISELEAMKAKIPVPVSVTEGQISGLGGDGNDQGILKVYKSPIEGNVTNVIIKPFETALKSEFIMSLSKNEDTKIKGFFDQSDLRYLKEGDEVKLRFPDGTESYGKINRFYFSTYRLPEEFQKKYEPTTRALSAEIIPRSKEEANLWKPFYKMEVEIVKPRYY